MPINLYSTKSVLLAQPKSVRSPDLIRGPSFLGSAINAEQVVQSKLTPITDEPIEVARLISAIEGFAASFGLKPYFSDADLKKLLSDIEPRKRWPAFYWIDEKKSGFVSLVEFPKYVEIKSIFVFPDARGQSLASTAVTAVKTLAQQMGKEVFALVGDGDGTGEAASRAFWQSIKFDLKPKTLYFSDLPVSHTSRQFDENGIELSGGAPLCDQTPEDTREPDQKAEGRAVFEFEDGVWQWDLGLVVKQPISFEFRFPEKIDYLSFTQS